MPNNPTTIRLTKYDKVAIKKLLKRYTFLKGTTAAIAFALAKATKPTTARVTDDDEAETEPT